MAPYIKGSIYKVLALSLLGKTWTGLESTVVTVLDPQMAVQAEIQPKKANPEWQPNKLQRAAMECHLAGILRPTIAKTLMEHFWPEEDWSPKLLSRIRNNVRSWESNQRYRDYLYRLAVERLDLDTPVILQGISGKAKQGRVDAAKLALEVTGRHSTKEVPITAIQLNFSEGIARPQLKAADIEGEVEE